MVEINYLNISTTLTPGELEKIARVLASKTWTPVQLAVINLFLADLAASIGEDVGEQSLKPMIQDLPMLSAIFNYQEWKPEERVYQTAFLTYVHKRLGKWVDFIPSQRSEISMALA